MYKRQFITQGGLSRVLDIGKEIIHQICQGIINSRGDIREGISSAIKQISEFVRDVAPEIEEAGRVILDAIRDGIKNNSQDIHDALDGVASVMNSWIQGSEEIKSLTGNFADIFIDSLIENLKSRTVGRASELWNAATSWLTHSKPDFSKGLTGFFTKISDWFTGESYAAETTGNEKELSTNKKNSKNSNKINSKLSSMDVSEIKALQTQLTALQTTAQNVSNSISQSFTNMQNTMRTSLVGCANIARNQFVSITNVARNQCLNVSNIVRNQFVSVSNIIKNQVTNARNALTTQMISIKNVTNTQITAARNAVTTQMISMKKVITTQSREARNNFTSQMISMKNVARTQSTQIGQAVASGMATGIRNGTARAVSAARSLVNQVNAEMKKTAKINSPSKITTKYGEYLDEGLIEGMKNKSKELYSVARSITTEMNENMKAAVHGEIALFNLNASNNNESKIINTTNNNFRLSDEDIQKLADANAQRPVSVETKVGESTLAKTIAKPIENFNKTDTKRLNRLKGVTI